MLRTVHLYGALGEKYGQSYDLDCFSVNDGVRALCAMRPGFEREFAAGHYEVFVGGKEPHECEQLPSAEICHMELANVCHVHIVPVVEGAKNGGAAAKIIIGLAIIVLAVATSGAGLSLGLSASGGMGAGASGGAAAGALMGAEVVAGAGITYSQIALVGAMVALGGLAQMLSKAPSAQGLGTAAEQNASFLFDGAVNSSAQGSPIPLIYGQMRVGSLIGSAGLSVDDIMGGDGTGPQDEYNQWLDSKSS